MRTERREGGKGWRKRKARDREEDEMKREID